MTGFKEFVIEDVFEKIETKKIKGKANDFPTEPSGNYVLPLLTAGIQNQGLARYAKREQCPTVISNAISVSANGANSGVVFYQPEEFAVLQDAYAIKLKEQEIPCAEVGLFLASSLWKAVASNHDWSFKAGWERIRKDKFSLPVTPSGEIDWDYMHERIAELEHERIAELEQYLIASGLNDCELTNEDNAVLAEYESKDMGEFLIGDLFEKLKAPYKGAGRKQDNVSKIQTDEYSLPLINCKDGCNGIMYYGRHSDYTWYENVFSVIYNGPPTEGQTYYQERIGLYTDAYLIRLKADVEVSRELGLFLTTAINKSIHNPDKKRYSRGNKATWEGKVEKDEVTLPVTSFGTPDYDFMERYIKAIQKLVIADVVKYKDEMISNTKLCIASIHT